MYRVNKYKMDVKINHVLPNNAHIIAYWPRPSSSNVLEDLIPINSGLTAYELVPHQRVKINYLNNTECSMTGYVYEVFAQIGGFVGWWPYNPNLVASQMEYSILTSTNPAFLNVETPIKTEVHSLELFPNPSIELNTISLLTERLENILINLYDIKGSFIKQMHKGETVVGQNNIDLNIETLSSGMYFYEVKLGYTNKYIKFVKQ